MTISMNRISATLVSAIFVAVFLGTLPADVDARGGKGGGKGGGMKGQTRTSVGGNRGGHNKQASKQKNTGNRNNIKVDNSKRNVNIDNSKKVNIDVDVDHRGGCCYGGGYYRHPVGTAIAVGVTAAIIGSVIYSLPPSCSTVIVGNVSYSQCGNDWYKPSYSGSSVTYVVVGNPY